MPSIYAVVETATKQEKQVILNNKKSHEFV